MTLQILAALSKKFEGVFFFFLSKFLKVNSFHRYIVSYYDFDTNLIHLSNLCVSYVIIHIRPI